MNESRTIGRWAAALAVCLSGACDRSPTALDAIQEDGLRHVIESAANAGPGSVEVRFRDLAWGMATIVEPTPRLPVLEELFERALDRAALRPERFDADAVRDRHSEMSAMAWQAVEDGRRDEADGALSAARSYMAFQTVEVLGEPVAAAYVALVGLAIDHAAARLERAGGYVEPRALRVLGSARNLHGDAGVALSNADPTRALDIAGHAAGLLNTLEMPSR